LASADTLGRVPVGLYPDRLLQTIFLVYQQLKRNKALPDHHGIGLAVLDGHESHASYRRHCAGCWQRTIHTERSDRRQHYHHQVTPMLLSGPSKLPANLPRHLIHTQIHQNTRLPVFAASRFAGSLT
jgi:hypothetical protein